MSKLLGRLLVLVFAAWTGAASATLNTDTVVVDGREWAQPDDVTNFSWNDFDDVCGAGLCTGQLGGTGPDLTGWVWASVLEVGALFRAKTPHPGGIASYLDDAVGDPLWAFNFLRDFDATDNDPSDFTIGVTGWTSTRAGATGNPFGAALGYFAAGFPRPGIVETDGIAITALSEFSVDFRDRIQGAWLYRSEETSVPAPATIFLFAIALAGLALTRRLPESVHSVFRRFS